MSFLRPRPKLVLEQTLSARPVRSASAELTRRDEGGVVSVPARPPRWAGWLLRLPAAARKRFELDPIGLFVWDQCDGKTSVRGIIHHLARRYQLTPREAEVATRQFLHTLARKGLIAFAVNKK